MTSWESGLGRGDRPSGDQRLRWRHMAGAGRPWRDGRATARRPGAGAVGPLLMLLAAMAGVLVLAAPSAHAQLPDSEITNLRLEPTQTSVRPAESAQFQAFAEFDSGLQARAQGVEWSSGATEIATIDSNGLATGHSSGTTEITAQYEGQSASATLTVAEVTSLEILPAQPSLDPGASKELAVVAEFGGDVRMDVAEVATWSSADSDVAAFDQQQPGLLTGQGPGSVEVTAEYGGATATETAEVAPIAELRIEPAEPSVDPGNTQRLEVVAELDHGGQGKMSELAEWTTSDPSVARISDIGLLRGETRGTVEITARVGEQRASVPATVDQSLLGVLNTAVDREIVSFGWVETAIRDANTTFPWAFDAIQWPVAQLMEGIEASLKWLPWYVVVLAVGAIAWWRMNSWTAGIGFLLMMLIVGFLAPQVWRFAMETLAMIITAVVGCALVGIPIGIWAASNDRVYRVVRPVLDAMQTIHPFIYLIPTVILFGTGSVPGTLATFVFALPPAVRLTNLGIRQVPGETVEAARAFGSTDRQTLWEVQLPLARPAIMQGLNQSLMLAYSMVVIAAIVAAGGLGQPILTAVQRVDIAGAVPPGLGLLILAIVLDRLTQSQRAAPTT